MRHVTRRALSIGHYETKAYIRDGSKNEKWDMQPPHPCAPKR